jgi:hypothetical protein
MDTAVFAAQRDNDPIQATVATPCVSAQTSSAGSTTLKTACSRHFGAQAGSEVFAMKSTLALAVSVLLLAPLSAVAAGPEAGDKSFTIAGSGSNDKNFDNGAYGITAELGYFQTDAWQAGLRQSINGFAGDEAKNAWNGASRFFVNYNFLTDSYRPYLGVNLGGIYGKGVSNTGTAGVEGGLKLYVLDKTYINFGAEYAFLFEDTNDFENKSNNGIVLYTIGVGFNW